jgi:hypothetical protein
MVQKTKPAPPPASRSRHTVERVNLAGDARAGGAYGAAWPWARLAVRVPDLGKRDVRGGVNRAVARRDVGRERRQGGPGPQPPRPMMWPSSSSVWLCACRSHQFLAALGKQTDVALLPVPVA